jgi:hypothetical protein
MFSNYLWKPLSTEKNAIIANEDNAMVSITNVSFYRKIQLVRKINNMKTEDYYLYYNNNYYHLNGESDAIHDANDYELPFITDMTLADYLKFFCFFIKNTEGPFYIIDSIESKYLDDIRKYLNSKILERIIPVKKIGYDCDFNFLVLAFVRYGNDLFQAKFQIPRDGKVLMIDDEAIWSMDDEV